MLLVEFKWNASALTPDFQARYRRTADVKTRGVYYSLYLLAPLVKIFYLLDATPIVTP